MGDCPLLMDCAPSGLYHLLWPLAYAWQDARKILMELDGTVLFLMCIPGVLAVCFGYILLTDFSRRWVRITGGILGVVGLVWTMAFIIKCVSG